MRSPTQPPHSNDETAAENAPSAAGRERGPERGSPPPRRPIVARPEAGKPNAPKPDPFLLRELEAEAAAYNALPSWLRPFTVTPTTRFTRTPDHLRPHKTAEEEAADALRAHMEAHPARPARPAAPVQPPIARTPPPRPMAPPPRQLSAEPPRAPVTPPQQPVAPQAEIAAPTVEVAPPILVAETQPHAELPQVASNQPESIRKLARLIRTELNELPQKPADQDDAPESRAPVHRPAAYEPDPAPAPAPAFTTIAAEAIVPSVLPIQAPLKASVRVSFAWPIEDGPEQAVVQPATLHQPEPAAIAVPEPVAVMAPPPVVAAPAPQPVRVAAPPQLVSGSDEYEFPSLDLLAEPPLVEPDFELSEEFLNKNSVTLQQTLRDFGVRGEIIDANPGPVVTLYELEPAPGTKSSRVIALSADISRSMSAVSARVAVVEGRNVIGIELPNQRRETVWLRELLASQEFAEAKAKLGLCLGKTIGGEPVIADLARMPHLLVAGTTGSGKSVAINTMILSLLYQYRPEACRLIMIDPKMLELSVYDGIPHLLTPVVTDPRKAVVALKWAVREMEERYKKMSRLGVRNIDGFNQRVAEATAKGEVITRQIATGFDKETGETVHEEEVMDLSPLPYIVVIVDEMADLMMVAGKDIEGAIQRLAQMARAAGIHLIMATQRPSVDVITGTIKANFPTRISFQVTSKIDSRTILGEMGAEQLLGQGDMLYMAGGGRITRVHGPFVSDHEVEQVVAHLKLQARPEYLESVTADEEEDAPAPAPAADTAVFDNGSFGDNDGDAYEQAIAIVLRDKKASTSYIQRRLQIGYNRAASIMERMEKEGVVGPANHAGKREILRDAREF